MQPLLRQQDLHAVQLLGHRVPVVTSAAQYPPTLLIVFVVAQVHRGYINGQPQWHQQQQRPATQSDQNQTKFAQIGDCTSWKDLIEKHAWLDSVSGPLTEATLIQLMNANVPAANLKHS